MGFPKRLLGDDEILVLSLRPHVKVLFVPALVLVLVAPAAALLAAYVPDWSVQPWLRGAIAVVAGVMLLRWTVWPFTVWWNQVYAITTSRLVIREGVFNRSGHDMPLIRLNDVSFEHNVWERMLGCGTLMVESAGERGQIVLDDVPKVEQVQRTLYQLSDDARTSARGVAENPEQDVDADLADRDELPGNDPGTRSGRDVDELKDTLEFDDDGGSPGDAGRGRYR